MQGTGDNNFKRRGSHELIKSAAEHINNTMAYQADLIIANTSLNDMNVENVRAYLEIVA